MTARTSPLRSVTTAQADIPETPRRVRVGMPHLDAAGLAENWLLRYAGELHWEAIGRRLGVRSDELCGAARRTAVPDLRGGARALRAVAGGRARERRAGGGHRRRALRPGLRRRPSDRAGGTGPRHPPGSAVAEHVRRARRAGRAAHDAAGAAARDPLGPPAADSHLPLVARLARAARRRTPLDDQFSGAALAAARPPLAELHLEPSPYADYNGAGLLYFASYVTIAETAERQLLRRLGLAGAGDPALRLSPVRRDVFYYTNLPLGDALVVELCEHAVVPGGVRTHLRLRRASDGERMADIVTRKLARP